MSFEIFLVRGHIYVTVYEYDPEVYEPDHRTRGKEK
jgi:hypothetical protein